VSFPGGQVISAGKVIVIINPIGMQPKYDYFLLPFKGGLLCVENCFLELA
jgi:hypothetical protein